MLAYRMRHRIQFQRQVHTQDPDTGEETTTWETVLFSGHADLPAEVLTGPGREFIAADATQAETTARINCRWFPLSGWNCTPGGSSGMAESTTSPAQRPMSPLAVSGVCAVLMD